MTESTERHTELRYMSEPCPRCGAPLREKDSSHKRGLSHSESIGPCPESGLSTDAQRLYRKATQEECRRSQHQLGVCYTTGKGVRQNWERGLMWQRRAAEQGYARAQFSLGLAYYTGTGAAKDHEEAKKWFEAAAQQGFVPAEIVVRNTLNGKLG